MKYTLGTAAKATGKAKSTILRAIKTGTISASKDPAGNYSIDPSELHRVFDATPTQPAPSNEAQPSTEHHDALRLRLEILEEERRREREQMQSTIDDLRARLDRSEDRITALLAAPDKLPTARWRFWTRS